ncbi:MAG: hypothetical protein IT562_07425 [Alphaproteobacteria bacterium]|nr:hypothetical protein [Alphaproteobacteria bacterium]
MLASKAVRAATFAVAGAFLLSIMPAAAAPVVPSVKPAGYEQSSAIELAATKKKPKKTAKKKTGKKTAAAKKPAKKTA